MVPCPSVVYEWCCSKRCLVGSVFLFGDLLDDVTFGSSGAIFALKVTMCDSSAHFLSVQWVALSAVIYALGTSRIYGMGSVFSVRGMPSLRGRGVCSSPL